MLSVRTIQFLKEHRNHPLLRPAVIALKKWRRLQSWGADRFMDIAFPALRDAFAIPSHVTKRERVQLYRLGRSAQRILEIGSYLGASAACFAAALATTRSDGKVYCVDTWGNETMPEGLRDTYSEFRRNTAAYGRLIVPMRGRSTDVVTAVRAQTEFVDLLFIDGDHSYDSVFADWHAYRGLLRKGSAVVFHDWGWAEGVQRVITEEAAQVVDMEGALPNLWWGRVR
jgi:predicted O-methyltransferase YrrM